MRVIRPLDADEPTTVGPYRLLGRLGSGGMGRVYLGRSEGGRTVAVKIVHPHHALDDEFRTRFRLEVEAARRVGGAWTAPVLDADPDARVPWVATAYAAGPSLTAAVADEGPLPWHTVRALGAGLAEALGAVHALGLVHRDVKPSNVLLTLDGPLLIDFGIARAMDSTASLTATGVSVGSPGYMAPEQILGRGVTGAADVFSLGAVLAFAASGRPPFPGDSSAALLYKVVHEEPELDSLATELRQLVAACLAKDPARRPSPREVAERLAPQGGAARLVTGGWLPGRLVERVSRDVVELLNLDTDGGGSSDRDGSGSRDRDGSGGGGRRGEVNAGGAPGVSGPGLPGPELADPGLAGADLAGAGLPASGVSGPVPFSAASVRGEFGPPGSGPSGFGPSESGPSGFGPSQDGAGQRPGHVPTVRDESVELPEQGFGAGGGAGAVAPAAVTGTPGEPPTAVPGPVDAGRNTSPSSRAEQGGRGRISVSLGATSGVGDGPNGRRRQVSCTVALAVAGALAAVTVGTVFVLDLLPGRGSDDSTSGSGAKPPAATGSYASPEPTGRRSPGAVPAGFLGTWEGSAVALNGALPDGTFRVTVQQASVGERLGTLHTTDALGGVCDDVLTLRKASEGRLQLTTTAVKSNPDVCVKGTHPATLTRSGDTLTIELTNSEAGNPVARMHQVGS